MFESRVVETKSTKLGEHEFAEHNTTNKDGELKAEPRSNAETIKTDSNALRRGHINYPEAKFVKWPDSVEMNGNESTEGSNVVNSSDSGIGADLAHKSNVPQGQDAWENEVLEFQKAKKKAIIKSGKSRLENSRHCLIL